MLPGIVDRLFGKKPGNPVPQLLSRADRARDGRSWASAAAAYGAALEIEPSLSAIWVQHGHALKELGNLAASEVSYRRSQALTPNESDTYLQLGHVLKLQGRVREAADNYLKALRIAKTSSPARGELAALGFPADAIDAAVDNGVLPGRPYLDDRPGHAWQSVADGLQRMRIERGWIYRTCIFGAEDSISCAMTFVPD